MGDIVEGNKDVDLNVVVGRKDEEDAKQVERNVIDGSRNEKIQFTTF